MNVGELTKRFGVLPQDQEVRVFIPYVGDVDITGTTTRGQLAVPELTPVQVLGILSCLLRAIADGRIKR